MSTEELLRGIFAVILGAALAWGIYLRERNGLGDEDQPMSRR